MLLQTTGALERLGRWLGATQVAVAAEVDHRSRHELGADGLAASQGCPNSTELLERITQASGEAIAKRLKVGRNTRARYSLVGEQLPAPFAHVAAATGTAPESPVPCSADETRIQTDVWKVRLDQDGRLPVEERALRMRSFSLGRERDGLGWAACVVLSSRMLPQSSLR